MPQLDISTYPSQIFWLAVTFILLYLAMAWWGLPRVGDVIARRRDRIEDDLARAAQMKAEAEAVIQAYERALAEARAQAQITLRETTERLAADAAARQRQVAERLGAESAAAERRIQEAKARALGSLREVAAEVAQVAAAKLTGAELGEARARAAVDAVLRERG